MLRVGLTGGIAAGKSTVARRFVEAGACLIDYDRIAHEITEPGGLAIEPIYAAFGKQAIESNGALNRIWLASQVFSSPAQLKRLNTIEHPLIYQEAARLEEPWMDTASVVVHDVPLLASVYQTIPFSFDFIITVEAPETTRIARMVNERHMTQAQAVARVANQASQADRERLADIVIDASQPIEQMFDCVDRIYVQLQQQAQLRL
ncbi:dephospho-CoA kinase [Bombiscardovia apis]|uniref:Dephospho-CoA kinase n=1 Tax=Bombiscardovia apis TaxID=2932182 RepID=A0ABN6SEN3_9BIFI|nr:dephospho-CoA kinase [Bombiscardovia apis]BDR54476.1 dephospho-CoA kinase [Bombiscardovia apis]